MRSPAEPPSGCPSLSCTRTEVRSPSVSSATRNCAAPRSWRPSRRCGDQAATLALLALVVRIQVTHEVQPFGAVPVLDGESATVQRQPTRRQARSNGSSTSRRDSAPSFTTCEMVGSVVPASLPTTGLVGRGLRHAGCLARLETQQQPLQHFGFKLGVSRSRLPRSLRLCHSTNRPLPDRDA